MQNQAAQTGNSISINRRLRRGTVHLRSKILLTPFRRLFRNQAIVLYDFINIKAGDPTPIRWFRFYYITSQ